MKRQSFKKSKSKRIFRSSSGVHPKNYRPGAGMRGGIRA